MFKWHLNGHRNKVEIVPSEQKITCLNIDCPERKGGECDVMERINKESWEIEFDKEFLKDYDNGKMFKDCGERCMQEPDEIKSFIKNLLSKEQEKFDSSDYHKAFIKVAVDDYRQDLIKKVEGMKFTFESEGWETGGKNIIKIDTPTYNQVIFEILKLLKDD